MSFTPVNTVRVGSGEMSPGDVLAMSRAMNAKFDRNSADVCIGGLYQLRNYNAPSEQIERIESALLDYEQGGVYPQYYRPEIKEEDE